MIVDCALYERGKRSPEALPFHTAFERAQARAGDFVWVGLFEPTEDELADLAEEFHLHPLAVEDAVHAHQRPKLERYGHTLFLVLKTATYVDHEEIVELGEVMLFVGDGFVVSVRHGDHGELSELRSRLEADPETLGRGPTAIVHAVLDTVVDRYESVLADIDVDIDEIEQQVFSNERRDHAQRIFKLKREVLDFRRAVRPLLAPVEHLATGKVAGLDLDLGEWFRDVHDHLLRVSDQLEALDAVLSSALSANLAQVGVRQNEDMRKISAWVAIAAVPTMIAGIYGMNFEHMPELGSTWGYPVVLLGMAGACFSLWRYFKRQGWL